VLALDRTEDRTRLHKTPEWHKLLGSTMLWSPSRFAVNGRTWHRTILLRG